MVRINNDPALMQEDVDACVHPGLDGLSIPKAESPEQIGKLAAQIDRLERARGLPPGHVRLSLAFETPRGVLRAQEAAEASPRIATMSVGPEDYCLELGVERAQPRDRHRRRRCARAGSCGGSTSRRVRPCPWLFLV